MKINQFNYTEFKSAGEKFIEFLYSEMSLNGIEAKSYMCDHVCFRVKSLEEYQFYAKSLNGFGVLLTESLVNGRYISTFLLDTPFVTKYHSVSLLELPAPKQETQYATGFEHAEFVIDESFEFFKSRFPNLDFIESGNKNLNPELCLKIDGESQIKFHHLSLDRVIEIEKANITDIIFDLDGTLVKSREIIYEINRITFSKVLEREVSLQESISNFHPEFSRLFSAFSLFCPIKQLEAIQYWGVVSKNFNYDLFDNIIEALESLHRNQFRLHLWTARDESSAKLILQDHGIENIFSTMSFANERESKPHPKSIKFDWQQKINNSFVVIGDSPTDIIGAKNINAIRVAAMWDNNIDKRALIKSGAELFFYNIREFEKWINTKAKALC